MTGSRTTRRRLLQSLAVAPLAPLITGVRASDRWSDVGAKAAAIERLRSMVVLHGGQEVLGRQFGGGSLDDSANIKSISKTLVATLVGAAINQGVLDSVDATLGALIPALLPRQSDPRVARLTLEDLLTMRTGLERTSGPYYAGWVNSDNWIEFVLSRPFVAEPGGPMLYSTGSYHVLGAVLAENAQDSLLALARQWLGEPLGIRFDPWTRDPQGYYLGGNEMALSPRALARVGELYRQGGIVNGRRLLDRAWITAAWTAHTRSPWSGHDYGYGWFLSTIGGQQAVYARGYGGQLLYVMPDAELTVVLLSDTGTPARSGGYIDTLHRLFANSIVPASRSG